MDRNHIDDFLLLGEVHNVIRKVIKCLYEALTVVKLLKVKNLKVLLDSLSLCQTFVIEVRHHSLLM